MQSHVVVLRLVHILGGVYWAGTIFFFSTFLQPSIQELGPDGGKVMIKFFERGFLNTLPAVALVTLASGLWLLWISSNGFDPAYMGSGTGIAISTGGVFATAAFLVGLFVVRPTALRVWSVSKELPNAADEGKRAALMAEMGVLRARMGAAARVVFMMLVVAVSLMAVGRYV